MILVTGAVGNVGRALVPLLAARGEQFRVLVRRPEKFKPSHACVQVAAGHFGAPESLPAALEGIGRLFLLSAVHPQMVELQCRAVDAARAAGVRHVVKLSGMDAAPDADLALGRWHGAVERHIEASGMAFTHLRPNIFMQNLLAQSQAIGREGVLHSAMGAGRVSVVDVRDIAAASARVLADPASHAGVRTLTGPGAIDHDAMAGAIAMAIGRAVRHVAQSAAQARTAMLGAGMPAWWADLLLELFAAAAAGRCATVSGDLPALLGGAATSFERFARDHAAAFAVAA